MREVNVALIGYAFMGRAHSNAWRQVGRFLSPQAPAAAQGAVRPRPRRT